MASLGELVVSLAANTAEFSSDLGRAAHVADQNMKSIGDAATKAGIAIQGMAIASATAMIGFGKAAIDAADSAGKMAQATGLSTEAFSELAYAANLADVSNEEFAASMVKLNKSVTEAAKGGSDAKLAYEALGISIRDGNGQLKSGEALLTEVADRFATFADGPNKSALALELFGKAGARMIPMLNEGADGLREARDEAKAFGLSIGEDAAKRAEQFNDNLTRLNAIQKGFSQEMASAVLPQLTEFEEELIAAAKNSDIFTTAGQASTVVLQTLSVLTAETAFVLKAVGREMGGIAAQFAALGRGDFAGFKAIGDELERDGDEARKSLDAFEEKIMSIGTAAKAAKADVAGVVKPPAPDLGILSAQQKINDMLLEQQRQTGYDQYKVELESYESLQKVRQDSAHEDALYAKKKVDELFKAGQDMYAVEVASYDQLEQLRADARVQELDERTKYAQAGLDSIKQEYSSEIELQGDHYADQLSRLIEARELGLVTEQQYADQRAEMAQANEDRINQISWNSTIDIEKFRKLSAQRQASTVADFFANITEATAHGSRTMFEINKAASLASATIKGIDATITAYKVGWEVGGPYGAVTAAVFAGIAATATGAMIAQIASTQYGSGGTPSIGGGQPATPVAPLSSQADANRDGNRTTIIQIVGGDTFNRKQIRDLVVALNENTTDGSRLILR